MGGVSAKRRYLRVAVTVALALFVLSGCDLDILGDDPTEHGIGTRYYTVTFDGNGNTSGSAPESMKAADSSYITLPGQGNMRKDGYIFDGWHTKSHSIDSPYMVNGYSDNTLYATWIVVATATPGTFTDIRDDKTYKTVKINDQTWMGENLNYDTANGRGSWCYNNDTSNCGKYGRLYDWWTARVVCPSGWHLPASEEWDKLKIAVGDNVAGKKLKSSTGWYGQGNGTDNYGFCALPGGGRIDAEYFLDTYLSNYFYSVDIAGFWWTATTVANTGEANFIPIFDFVDYIHESDYKKSRAVSVRCIAD
jgi:uncharacterized protein (TIGR02145 family)/uncharacterized repeat protein (TIGR02543 family)